MSDDGMKFQTIEIYFDKINLVDDYELAMGKPPPGVTIQCREGHDHTDFKFVFLTFTPILGGDPVKVMAPEGSPLFDALIQGILTYEAQATLARLAADDVDLS